jgi:FAD/FMN-containing dehydrogenase
VQADQAQAVANAQGFVVVGGDCPTVGIAGGYTQGGGTSPLASRFGLAADQVLEWEVVTGVCSFLPPFPRLLLLAYCKGRVGIYLQHLKY